MDEQELENMLKHFGQVISTRILRDSSGHSRGVGFARSDPCLLGMLLQLAAYAMKILAHFDSSNTHTPSYWKGLSEKTVPML